MSNREEDTAQHTPASPGCSTDARHPPASISLSALCTRICHALRNPLSGVLLNAQMLGEEISEYSPLHSYLRDILEGTRTMEETLLLLSDFAAPRQPVPRSLNLSDTTVQIARWLARRGASPPLYAHADSQEDLRLAYADPEHVRTILIQLAHNAVEALPQGGEIHFHCSNISFAAQTGAPELGVEVSIRDNGTGIPEDDIPRVFEPFFTTRPKRIGLGLSIVSLLCGRNHGRVFLESRVGEGTTARIQLPAAAPGPQSRLQASAPPSDGASS